VDVPRTRGFSNMWIGWIMVGLQSGTSSVLINSSERRSLSIEED